MNYKSIFKTLLLMLCVCFLFSGCKKNKQEKEETKKVISGIAFANLDTTVNPADDFYQYACGGWVKNHSLPAEYSRYGSFDQLGESTEKQLNQLIVEVAKKSNTEGTIAQKIADIYNCGMDTFAIQQEGNAPIQQTLQTIANIKNVNELTQVLIDLHKDGYTPFFEFFGYASPENSSLTIAWMQQSGLGLGERDYYLDATNPKIKEGYITMAQHLFDISGYEKMTSQEGKGAALAQDVWKLETALAKIFVDKNDLRDPIKTKNVMPLANVKSLIPTVDLQKYTTAMVPAGVSEINVVLPVYFKSLNQLLKTQNLQTIKTYIAWNVIREAAPYLSDNFVNEHFNFYGKIFSGKEVNKDRWKRVIGTVSGLLGEPVGQLYVQQFFPAEAKQKMLHLVDNLKAALGDRIMQNDWMTEATKEKAKDKLNAIIVKIGYPDKWRDYSGLVIKKDGYYANIIRASRFENEYNFSKIGKPVDRTQWQMTPQTVNAYYDPSTNEICFPAAILQPPFFDMNADDAVNYGAIGVVIGHEMTHGFDDQGRQYDKMGNVNDWWTEEDSKNFAARTQVLVDYFNQIEVLPGLHADGKFTLGENIADNGGVNVSYSALQRAKAEGNIAEELDGFTSDQRFFLAYAGVWANNIRDAEIEKRTKSDPHSLGKWRVNGTLPHIDTFIKAFNVKEGDGMFLAPEKRAKIW